jgi:hypothetical protein
VFLAVSLLLPAFSTAESPSLAGEWRVGSGERFVVIEQDGSKVHASWKQPFIFAQGRTPTETPLRRVKLRPARASRSRPAAKQIRSRSV